MVRVDIDLRSTKFRNFLFCNFSTQDLRKNGCDECGSTGLHGVISHKEGFKSWPVEYCEKCEGIGFINIKEIMDMMLLDFL